MMRANTVICHPYCSVLLLANHSPCTLFMWEECMTIVYSLFFEEVCCHVRNSDVDPSSIQNPARNWVRSTEILRGQNLVPAVARHLIMQI